MSIIFYIESVIALFALYKAAWNLGTGKVLKGVLYTAVLFSMGFLMSPELNTVLSAMV